MAPEYSARLSSSRYMALETITHLGNDRARQPPGNRQLACQPYPAVGRPLGTRSNCIRKRRSISCRGRPLLFSPALRWERCIRSVPGPSRSHHRAQIRQATSFWWPKDVDVVSTACTVAACQTGRCTACARVGFTSPRCAIAAFGIDRTPAPASSASAAILVSAPSIDQEAAVAGGLFFVRLRLIPGAPDVALALTEMLTILVEPS